MEFEIDVDVRLQIQKLDISLSKLYNCSDSFLESEIFSTLSHRQIPHAYFSAHPIPRYIKYTLFSYSFPRLPRYSPRKRTESIALRPGRRSLKFAINFSTTAVALSRYGLSWGRMTKSRLSAKSGENNNSPYTKWRWMSFNIWNERASIIVTIEFYLNQNQSSTSRKFASVQSDTFHKFKKVS